MLRIIAILAAWIALLPALPASAAPPMDRRLWSAGDWAVDADDIVAGCSAVRALGNGAAIIMAEGPDGSSAHLLLLNPAWQISVDQKYDVSMQFDGGPKKQVQADAIRLPGGRSVLQIRIDDRAFAKSRIVHFVMQGEAITATLADFPAVQSGLRRCVLLRAQERARVDLSRPEGSIAAPLPVDMIDEGEGMRFSITKNWMIGVAPTGGCFANAVFEGQNLVLWGYDPARRGFYINFAQHNWRMPAGRYYVFLELDGVPQMEGLWIVLSGTADDMVSSSLIQPIYADFIDKLARTKVLRLRFAGGDMVLQLGDVGAAVDEVVRCQANIGKDQ